MKFSKANLLLSSCLLLIAVDPAKVTRNVEQDYSKFLIDANKPYVYLEVDHVGPRKPLRNDEPTAGIWFRLRNNCKLPIIVLAVWGVPKNPDNSLTLQDEVVPIIQGVGEDARAAGLIAPRGSEKTLEGMDDIFRFPNLTEEEVRRAEVAQRTSAVLSPRPAGYNLDNGFDSFELTLILSGEQVSFSVPANHVNRDWHMEVPFRLAVPNKSRIRSPYSYLAFYQEDLDRALSKAPPPTTH